MKESYAEIQAIMCFSGHDPSGGAGIQADIETINQLGGHCTPIITALTAQDSHNVKRFVCVDPHFMIEQAQTVLADFNIRAFKIGMLGSIAIIEALQPLLRQYPHIPVVFDPVLKAGGGLDLIENNAVIEAMRQLIMPHTTVITPNTYELNTLANKGNHSTAVCVQQLIDHGCAYVFATGTHDLSTEHVINRLWSPDTDQPIEFSWPRLPHHYHGSGCTLASAIATYLGHGDTPQQAIQKAQFFTWHALNQSKQKDSGQHLPHRNLLSIPNSANSSHTNG